MDDFTKTMLNICAKTGNTYPYYAWVFDRNKFVIDENCPTAGINYRGKISINTQFLSTLKSDKAQMFILIHENLHWINDHHHRTWVHPDFGKISPVLFNIAQDMENNDILRDLDDGTIHPWYSDMMNYPPKLNFEAYLELMKQDMDKDRQKNPNPFGDSCDDGGDSNDNNGESSDNSEQNDSNGSQNNKDKNDIYSDCKDEVEKRIRDMRIHQDNYAKYQKIIEDALSKSSDKLDMDGYSDEIDEKTRREIQDIVEQCKKYGDGTEFHDIIREIKTVKYDWKTVFDSIIASARSDKSFGRNKSTYMTPNRRMSAVSQDIIYPHKYDEEFDFNIVVGMDISGSMGDLTNQMYARLKSLSHYCHVTLLECDVAITNVIQDFSKVIGGKFESTAGGGTDMEAIPAWVEEKVGKRELLEPDIIVIMTDNYTSWSGNSRYKNKIVVLTNNVSSDCPYRQCEVVI